MKRDYKPPGKRAFAHAHSGAELFQTSFRQSPAQPVSVIGIHFELIRQVRVEYFRLFDLLRGLRILPQSCRLSLLPASLSNHEDALKLQRGFSNRNLFERGNKL